MAQKKGNREVRKPKQIKEKPALAGSISELAVKSTLSGKRR